MRTAIIVFGAVVMALLAGCQASLPVPERIDVPVPIACVDAPPAKPELPTDAQLATLDSYHAMIALWLDRLVRQIYEARLEAALAGCWQKDAAGT